MMIMMLMLMKMVMMMLVMMMMLMMIYLPVHHLPKGGQLFTRVKAFKVSLLLCSVQCADKQSQRTRADMLHKKLNIVDGPFVGIWYIIETRQQFSTTNHTQFGVFWVVRGTGMPLGFVTLSFHHIPEV